MHNNKNCIAVTVAGHVTLLVILHFVMFTIHICNVRTYHGARSLPSYIPSLTVSVGLAPKMSGGSYRTVVG